MEINIKTLDEARNSRVYIAVRTDRGTEEAVEFVRQNAEVNLVPAETGTGTAGSSKWSNHLVVTSLNDVFKWDKNTLYTREVVMDLQANEAELRAAPLERRIKELQAELAQRADLISELRGEVERAKEKVRLYDQDRHTERDRADGNQERAERAEVRARNAEKLAAEMKERAEERAGARFSRAEVRARNAEKLAAEMKERAEKAEKLAETFKASAYRENDKGVNDRQRIKLARQSLRQFFPEQMITDDIAPRITELITEINSLNGRLIEAETQRRLLSTATTALRQISQEVAVQDSAQPVANRADIIDNVRDLSAPWAKDGRPLCQS